MPTRILPMLLAVLALGAGEGVAAEPADAGNVRAFCSGCHKERAPGQFERISDVRKSPEGWVMTLFRMRQVHSLPLPDDIEAAVLRYLADTQGLAPSESAPARFALERRPNAQDIDLGPELGVMCGRCHTLARIALQRRDADEWLKHMHFHLGQFPTMEYQASGRDRPWWQIASTKLPADLGQRFPLATPAWSDWQRRAKPDLAGRWIVAGHEPGGRDFYGTADITREAGGDYRARYALTVAGGGGALGGESHAIVYTGYEWRGRGTLDGRAVREVYAASEDGSRMSGRWFDPEHAEQGGDWTAIRADAPPAVLAVLPRALRAGTTTRMVIVGSGLGAAPATFGPGTTVATVRGEPNLVEADVAVAADAAPGARELRAGGASGALVVYRQIDALSVQPAYGIARLGGGKIDPVTAQFEAIGATRLPGGELVTLGPVAAEWATLPYDEDAKRAADNDFAGHIEQNGRYRPAGAGPNPKREFSGNNVGNLAVVARLRDQQRTLEGRAHLVVTVQRWNTPPIY